MNKKLYIVGIGPGEYEQMTIKAVKTLESSDVIVGYTVYVHLIEKYFKGKEFLTTPMKKEVDRCILAFEEAEKGKKVSLVCSGDSGVYGMAEIVLRLSSKYKDVELAAKSNFVIWLYNHSSKKRQKKKKKACDLIMKFQKKDTICGYVKNIGREKEEYKILTLEELRESLVDMFTTVFIGNSQTKEINGKMVTPRGYKNV